MQEIITRQQVDSLFLALAVAGPLIGAGIGWFCGRRAFTGLLWGLLLSANWVLWLIYNALTDRLGLDTVRNLLVNLGLFVTLGAVVGCVAAIRWRRRNAYAVGANHRQTTHD